MNTGRSSRDAFQVLIFFLLFFLLIFFSLFSPYFHLNGRGKPGLMDGSVGSCGGLTPSGTGTLGTGTVCGFRLTRTVPVLTSAWERTPLSSVVSCAQSKSIPLTTITHFSVVGPTTPRTRHRTEKSLQTYVLALRNSHLASSKHSWGRLPTAHIEVNNTLGQTSLQNPVHPQKSHALDAWRPSR